MRTVFFFIFVGFSNLSGCGKGDLSCETEEGRRAIVAEVDRLLSDQDCTGALAVIEPYYPQAACASDEIRLARASANACAANVNFFQVVGDLGTNNLVGNELWVTLTKLFPSSLTDQRLTGGQNSLDALYALRIPGMLTPSAYVVNATSANPGSLIAAHRTDDSNVYSMLVSMALIGTLQNRYGAPGANFHRTQKIGASLAFANGWETAAAVDVNACTYAGAILTLFDSIVQIGSSIGGSVGSTVGTVLVTASNTYTSLLDAACDSGCVACGMAAGSCTPCPIQLRDRFSCTGVATDKPTCAATGIATFMNSTPVGLGWPN